MKYLIIIACVALLTACAERPVVVEKVKTVREQVPTPLRVCQPAPLVPDCTSQRCVAAFIARDRAAGEDCRQTVARVKEWAERPRPGDPVSLLPARPAPSLFDKIIRLIAEGLGTIPPELAMRE